MNAKKSQYWILPIHRSVQAEPPVGPFGSFEAMLPEARKLRKKQKEEDGIFWLNVKTDGKLFSGSFSNLDLEVEVVTVNIDIKPGTVHGVGSGPR